MDNVIEISEESFLINGINFQFEHGGYTRSTDVHRLIVFKPLHYFRTYLNYAKLHNITLNRIFELGIAEGGSAILFALLVKTAKIVAIDNQPPKPHVLDWIDRLGLTDRVKLYFGVGQDDRTRIAEIIDREFSGDRIDFVLDDASHLYEQTKASFEIMFPQVSNGGLYIIEDWAWAHWASGQAENLHLTALSNLIFELCMFTGTRVDIIDEMKIDSGKIIIRVKSTDSLQAPFNLDDAYFKRNKKLIPI